MRERRPCAGEPPPKALAPIEVRRHGGSGPAVVVLHGGPGLPGSAGDPAAELGATCRVWEPLQRRGGEVLLTVARHVADCGHAPWRERQAREPFLLALRRWIEASPV